MNRLLLLAITSILLLFCTSSALAFHVPPWDTGHESFDGDDGDDDNDPGDDACPDPDKCREGRMGSPVEVATGNFVHSVGLLALAGRGPVLDLVLTYNSRDNRKGPFGHGWVHPYDQRLIETTDGVNVLVIITEPDGKRETYQRNSDGTFQSPPHVFSTLTKLSDGTYRLKDKFGWLRNFDSEGRLSSIVDRNSNALTFTYDGSGFLTQMRHASGRTIQLIKGGTGRVASLTDPAGRSFTFSYDAAANLTQITDPAGNAYPLQYDAKNNLRAVLDALGRVQITVTYDTGGRVSVLNEQGLAWTYTYNAASRQTSKRDSSSRTWVYTYNQSGVITSIRDPFNNVETFSYDGNLNLLGHTDKNGRTTTFTYDGRGNVLTRTDSGAGTRTTVYDPTFSLPVRITDSRGSVSRFDYDAKGNLIQHHRASGVQSTFQYDANGLLTRIADPASQTTVFEYDTNGHLVRVIDPVGNATSSTFDQLSRVTSNADGEGRTQQYTYDASSRLTRIRNAVGDEAVNQFDSTGNLTSTTDFKGTRTTFTYDTFNRLATMTNSAHGSLTFGYDARGLLVTRRDALNQTTSYAYDNLSRLTQISYPGNTISYTYDRVGNLLTAVDTDSSISFTYDVLNRMGEARTNATLSQPATLISYQYDTEGNRTRLTDSAGGIFNYTYDTSGRLTGLTNPAGQTFQITYDSLSRRTGVNRGGLINTTYSYDLASRLTQLQHTGAGAPVLFAMTLDRSGNRLTVTDSSGLHAYTYDSLYRLTATSHPSATNEAYTYDQTGNRLTSHLSSVYQYDAGNRLTSDSTNNYTYDANGNLIRKTDRSSGAQTNYSYDANKFLTQINFPSGKIATYRYDAFGRRVSKTYDGVTTQYVYDRLDVLMEYTGGTLVARYTHGPGVDELLAITRGTTSAYVEADYLHSVVRVVSTAGTELYTQQYDSFGRTLATTGSPVSPYGFQGREFDSESGLYYYRARYYDPQTGRFITADPLPYVGGYNLYSFVGGNPINQSDALGLAIETGWDIFNVVTGAASLGANIASGNVVGALVDAAGLVVDIAATVVPGVPAGASTAINIYRGSKLARSMANAGRPIKKGVEACHHIVARTAKKAKEARDKLKQLGMDVDDAENGVGLAKDIHSRLHTDEYYDMINQASRNWQSKDDAVKGLEQIRNQLLQNGK